MQASCRHASGRASQHSPNKLSGKGFVFVLALNKKIVHFLSLTVPNQPYLVKSIVWNHCVESLLKKAETQTDKLFFYFIIIIEEEEKNSGHQNYGVWTLDITGKYRNTDS